jgi:hypothetical protein
MSSSESSSGGSGVDSSPYPLEEWDIRPKEEFAAFRIPEVVDPLEGALLLYADRNGFICGQSKFVLAVVDVELPAADLMICGGASGYKLAWQIWPPRHQDQG